MPAPSTPSKRPRLAGARQRSPGLRRKRGPWLSQYQPTNLRWCSSRSLSAEREADSGYAPAISHILWSYDIQLAQHKPRQTWHPDVSLERARLRLGEGAEPRLVDAERSDEDR